jgi:hypothetical protein
MTIEDKLKCPHCGIRRLADYGAWGLVCMNCRLTLDRAQMSAPQPPQPAVQAQLYPFSPIELVRLEAYRAAIQAGLYSDWPVEV